MKKNLISFFALTLIFMVSFALPSCGKNKGESKITISGAFALYPMVVKWTEEYKKINPAVSFDVSGGGAGKGITDALSGMVDIGMVSREITSDEIGKGAWPFPVAKDAVVGVINKANPYSAKILEKGLTKQNLTDIFITGKIKKWDDIVGGSGNYSIKVYTRSDACGAASVWAEFMGKKQEDLQGTGVYGDPGLADAVKNDSLGIGYNNINYAYDSKSKKPNEGLVIIPLDMNGDGTISKDEYFYGSLDEITKAIADKKYPSPPARSLYLVCKGKPTNEAVISFIKWVLTDGQKYIEETGYIKLPEDMIKQSAEKL